VVSSTLHIGSAFGTAVISGAFFGAIGAHATPAGAASAARVAARGWGSLKKMRQVNRFHDGAARKIILHFTRNTF
jgi:hypothetical protein